MTIPVPSRPTEDDRLVAQTRDSVAFVFFDFDQPLVGQIGEQSLEPLPAVLAVRCVVDADPRAELVKGDRTV